MRKRPYNPRVLESEEIEDDGFVDPRPRNAFGQFVCYADAYGEDDDLDDDEESDN